MRLPRVAPPGRQGPFRRRYSAPYFLQFGFSVIVEFKEPSPNTYNISYDSPQLTEPGPRIDNPGKATGNDRAELATREMNTSSKPHR